MTLTIDVVYDCNGKRLSSHSISIAFWSFPEIKQFQFIQESETDYVVKLKVTREFKQRLALEEWLLSLLGPEARITIELVDDIPVLASGKSRYIFNKMI